MGSSDEEDLEGHSVHKLSSAERVSLNLEPSAAALPPMDSTAPPAKTEARGEDIEVGIAGLAAHEAAKRRDLKKVEQEQGRRRT